MRVLSVGNLYPPHHFGGYEQVWAAAVRYLRREGHEVRVLAADYRHSESDVSDEPEERDVYRTLRWYWKDHDFARFGLAERLRIERHNQRQLDVQLAALEPDVVSFWSMGGMSHSLLEQVRRRDIPIVVFVHDEWLDYGRWTDQWTRIFRLTRYRWAAPLAEKLTGLPTRVCYGAAGRYVFVSEFIRQRALSLGLGLNDTAVAHSGIAPVFRADAGGREWGWRLLYVGRPHPDKGIEDAVRCLTALPRQASLTFAGSWDPREEAALRELVRELGLERQVRMLGQLEPTAVAELYRASDVLLFPARWEEPWGLVPLEAMACGCPVVATARGGSTEYLLHGHNCLLVSDRDPAALAEAVQRLAADRTLREHLQRGGHDTAGRYTEESFTRQVEAHLRDAIGDQRREARSTAGPLSAGPKYSSARAGTPPTSV